MCFKLNLAKCDKCGDEIVYTEKELWAIYEEDKFIECVNCGKEYILNYDDFDDVVENGMGYFYIQSIGGENAN